MVQPKHEAQPAAEPQDVAAGPPPEQEPEREEHEPEDLSAQLDQLAQQRDEYLDALRRERADFENYRKRMTRERMDALDRGAEALVANLLGVLENFGYVLDAAEESPDDQLAKGVRMVHAELVGVLQQAGLEQLGTVGEPFDPNWHEAVSRVEPPAPVEHPTVVEVLRPGYRFKGRVLRPAAVSVAQ